MFVSSQALDSRPGHSHVEKYAGDVPNVFEGSDERNRSHLPVVRQRRGTDEKPKVVDRKIQERQQSENRKRGINGINHVVNQLKCLGFHSIDLHLRKAVFSLPWVWVQRQHIPVQIPDASGSSWPIPSFKKRGIINQRGVFALNGELLNGLWKPRTLVFGTVGLV